MGSLNVMADDVQQQLQDAIARNTAAVLSLPSAGMLRHLKSRFLAMADDGFWMECEPDQAALIDELTRTEKPVGVSYKTGQLKTVFTAVVLGREVEYRINADTTVFAVRLKLPAEIKQMQRRQSYRVRVPEDFELRLEIWRIAPKWVLRDKPSNTLRVQAELVDLSTGGLGVIFVGENGEKPRVCTEDRLRIVITTAETELLVEGAMRFPLPGKDPSRVRAGIQFKGLDNDLEGRQHLAKLQKIVGELQRHEARRARLGVA
jgi:c-di-GMP-binding flagellar brake protein YcgR